MTLGVARRQKEVVVIATVKVNAQKNRESENGCNVNHMPIKLENLVSSRVVMQAIKFSRA